MTFSCLSMQYLEAYVAGCEASYKAHHAALPYEPTNTIKKQNNNQRIKHAAPMLPLHLLTPPILLLSCLPVPGSIFPTMSVLRLPLLPGIHAHILLDTDNRRPSLPTCRDLPLCGAPVGGRIVDGVPTSNIVSCHRKTCT